MSPLEIKQALQNDPKFRELFPELSSEIEAFLKNPSCNCNGNLYRKIIKFKDRIPGFKPMLKQDFEVINCKASELDERLKKVKRVVGTVSLARWQDEVTVVLRYLS